MVTKVAFIGAGGIAGAHMPNVADREDTQITAICDIVEDRAKAAAEKFGATPYTDYRAMLDAEDLDAAYVCIIPSAHGTIELDLTQRGIPFCVEKPVNLDLAGSVKVAKAVCEAGLVTCVGYQVRYAPQVAKAAQFVRAHGASLVEGWFVGGMPGTPWWRVKAQSGGQAVEQTTHIYDLARCVVGEVESVCAYGSTGAMTDIENYDIEDASVALLRFAGGAVGHICSGCTLTDGGAPHTGLRIDGRAYTVELHYTSLKISSADGVEEEEHPGALGPAMRDLDHTFLTAAETGDGSKILSSYEDGMKSAAVSLAVNRSMETGGTPVGIVPLLKQAGWE